MNIGTAKPADELLEKYPHHLIDIRDPWESYSAGDFCRDIAELLPRICSAGRIPVLVGGTMLYFQALQRGLAELPEADAELRVQLNERAAQEGWPAMHAELAQLDPETAARLRPTDAQRIQRALEVCLIAGEPMSVLLATTSPPVNATYLNIGLIPADRSVLHGSIAQRLNEMLAEGLEDEIRALLARTEIDANIPAMRAVGYRQIARLVGGEVGPEEACDKAIIATRRLAKRQMTWLRSWPDLHIVDSLAPDRWSQLQNIVAPWIQSGATV
jgi:tRNA dimethylallyltransferase